MGAVAILFALLSLYYLRFFLFVRSEPTTLVQIALLLGAGALLTRRPVGAAGTGRVLAVAGAVLLALLLVFVLADHGSHSASDTLTRMVPASCLILAAAAWLLRRRPTTERG